MSRYDRYALSQIGAVFGLFALVLALVYWINRAVALFDRLIADGQSFLVFLEFTALTLPLVFRLTVPVAAFAAAVYVAHRMRAENELSALRAGGASSARLARPALVFGVGAALFMSVLMHLLVPLSRERLDLRGEEIAADATARLLTEGAFVHPAPGITFYLREIDADGTLRDVFLSDARDPAAGTLYTAASAVLTRGPSGTRLVMFDGLAQSMRPDGPDGHGRLFATRFADLAYDVSAFGGGAEDGPPNPRDLTTGALLASGLPPGRIALEAHRRGAEAAITLAAPAIGFAAILLGLHSRTGVRWQIALAVAVLIAVKLVQTGAEAAMEGRPELWPLSYVPGAAGLAAAWAMLRLADRTRRAPGAAPAPS